VQVYGYTRVSTDEQARDGVSLAMQQAKLEAYAVVKDWTLVEVIRDEGVSAKSLWRPGLERMVAQITAKEVDVVMIYKLDRLTRSVVDLGKLLELFKRQRVDLVSLQESLDATTATGRLMMHLLASVSQWEREVIAERTRDALQHLKAQGKRYCHAAFDEHPDAAALLTQMQAERAAGRLYEAIADGLNTAGMPTVVSGRWQGNTVQRILLRAAPVRERGVA
jgi:site-specific DNA recombinase